MNNKNELILLVIAFVIGAVSGVNVWNQFDKNYGEKQISLEDYHVLQNKLLDYERDEEYSGQHNEEVSNYIEELEDLVIQSSFNSLPILNTSPFSDTEIYTNTKYGYRFKYPSDHTPWIDSTTTPSGVSVADGVVIGNADDEGEYHRVLIKADENSPEVNVTINEHHIFCCEPTTLSFEVKPLDFNMKEKADELFDWDPETYLIQEIVFGGVDSLVYRGNPSGPAPSIFFVVPRGDYTLVISSYFGMYLSPEVLNNVLMTFEFTN